MREQFMTVQVRGRIVTGLTSDGRFVQRRWRGPLPAVGALVSEPAEPRRGFWALAATVALLILVLQVPFLSPLAQAGTMVAIDINPSFELSLAPSGQVTALRAANTDAQPIVAAIGALPPALPDALDVIIDAVAAAGKLKADGDNLILIGVVPGWRGLPAGINLAALEGNVAGELDRLGIDGLVHASQASAAELARARYNRLSLNRYELVRRLREAGQNVTFAEARVRSAGQLLKDLGLTPDGTLRGQRGGPHKNGGAGPTSSDTDGNGQGGAAPGSSPRAGQPGGGNGSTGAGGNGNGNGGGNAGSGSGSDNAGNSGNTDSGNGGSGQSGGSNNPNGGSSDGSGNSGGSDNPNGSGKADNGSPGNDPNNDTGR